MAEAQRRGRDANGHESSDEEAAPPRMRAVLVARRAPRDMTYNRRSASISCGKLMDFEAFQEELLMLMEFALFECHVMKQWTQKQRAAFLLYLAGMQQQMQIFMCDPMVITLPFKSVYLGRIRDHDMDTCYRCFRFVPENLNRLVQVLQLPEYFVMDNRAKLRGETVMLVSLYYLSEPVTQEQVADKFGLTCQPDISRVWKLFEEFVYSRFQHLIAHGEDPDDDAALVMWTPFLSLFKSAIRNWHVEGIDSTMYVRSSFLQCLL